MNESHADQVAAAMLAARQYGDEHARKHGRAHWTEEDSKAAAEEFHRLMPCPPGTDCPYCTKKRAGAIR